MYRDFQVRCPTEKVRTLHMRAQPGDSKLRNVGWQTELRDSELNNGTTIQHRPMLEGYLYAFST